MSFLRLLLVCMLVVSMLLISNILPQRKQIFVFFLQMTEEDLAAQMEADRLLQATLRAQVRQILFLKIQNILASL